MRPSTVKCQFNSTRIAVLTLEVKTFLESEGILTGRPFWTDLLTFLTKLVLGLSLCGVMVRIRSILGPR